MVFNFPQRYLHSTIYISFVRNCLVHPPSPSRAQVFDSASFFQPFKNCGLSYLHVVNLPSKLLSFSKSSNAPILNVYVTGLYSTVKRPPFVGIFNTSITALDEIYADRINRFDTTVEVIRFNWSPFWDLADESIIIKENELKLSPSRR